MTSTPLLLETLDRQPLRQLQRWLGDAVALGLKEPNAMALASATLGGIPSVRIVLCKGIDDESLTFFTNYSSRKGQELDANPRAAVVFHWAELGRQVRVEGAICRATSAESDAYFLSRPRGSQLGAWASPQSQELAAYADLTEAYDQREQEFEGSSIARPAAWGGYRLVASACEFWLTMPSRLHDRVVCRRAPGASGSGSDVWRWAQIAP